MSDATQLARDLVAALVGAGVLSVMVFPGLAVALNARRGPDPDPGGVDLPGGA